MRTAIITIVRGRHDHLRRQREWIGRLNPRPFVHVVVNMGDPEIPAVLGEAPTLPTLIVTVTGDPMPLAAARNAGAAAALQAGAELLILLDVDCLPMPSTVADYQRALDTLAASHPVVLCGRVRYLPDGLTDGDYVPERLLELGDDHSARVVPNSDEPVAGDPRLLWSLNLGVSAADWERIGGFDEAYVGYGGEDTDFGMRLRAAGGSMYWLAGAIVFHQYHPSVSPPVHHAESIARNANLFRARWGFDPMEGWLHELRELGVLNWDASLGWQLGEGADVLA